VAAAPPKRHRFVFIGGVHRSGTTFLWRCLAQHPMVSSFPVTIRPPAEGQLLQTVYPRAAVHGGPGRFGFAPEAHLTEASELVSSRSRAQLLADWSPHWDLAKPVLLEKSPPNLIRARFLQALFPESWFVMILRHPIPVSYATKARFQKKMRLGRLIRHWLACHETFAGDRTHLARVHVVRYEELVADLGGTVAAIDAFLGLDPHAPREEAVPDRNGVHFERWRQDPERTALIERFEDDVNRFGYSLMEFE
jgi:hypothetical protein